MFLSVPSQDLYFQRHVVAFVMLLLKVIVRFVYIGRI